MSNGALKLLAGAGATSDPVYVDDVFSTFLYDGNGSTQNIVNGLDLSGEGGLVWIKARNQSYNHFLFDTVRGASSTITADGTGAAFTTSRISSFNNNGFSLGTDDFANGSGSQYAAWSFRKTEKFFDVVTYSGTGSAQNISHNLGSVPGFIWVKRYSGTEDWICYHRSLGNTSGIALNQTNAAYTGVSAYWNSTTPTDSVFTVGTHDRVNTNGHTYVAYLFAHNEADFGTDSDEAIIHCGTYTGNGTSSTSTQHIDLGFEPQFFIVKVTTMAGQDWFMYDTMRGLVGDAAGDMRLMPSSNTTEYQYLAGHPSPTGLQLIGNENEVNKNGETYVYMAIRRPHKPASEFAANKLFSMDAAGQTSNPAFVSNDHIVDMAWEKQSAGTDDALIFSRLTGSKYLNTTDTSAESTGSSIKWDYMNGCLDGFGGATNYQAWMFRRAPGFFDVVCYSGQSAEMSVSHNLGVTPELIIQKCRTQGYGYNWNSWFTGLTNSQYINLNSDAAVATSSNFWGTNSTVATDSVFRVGTGGTGVNGGAGETHIAYLFATTAGISKVGTYSGTGSAQDIDCGFSSGARFILIKRTDTAVFGTHWLYWDTERGIVAGNDPYLFLDLGAAQNASGDYIDPLASGFTITSDAPAFMNASGGTYLFLAIA